MTASGGQTRRGDPQPTLPSRLSGRVRLGEALERLDRLQQQAGGSVGQRVGVDLLATVRRGVQLEGIAADVLAQGDPELRQGAAEAVRGEAIDPLEGFAVAPA